MVMKMMSILRSKWFSLLILFTVVAPTWKKRIVLFVMNRNNIQKTIQNYLVRATPEGTNMRLFRMISILTLIWMNQVLGQKVLIMNIAMNEKIEFSIVIWKRIRSCTQHPIIRHMYYSKLSESYECFISSFSSCVIPMCVEEAKECWRKVIKGGESPSW